MLSLSTRPPVRCRSLPSFSAWQGFLPVFVGGLHLASSTSCNGGDICSLPLVRTTFAGSHNAGAFDLTGPSSYGDVKDIALCFYLNHNGQYLTQLALGTRYFNIDLCDKDDDDTLYNCHAQGTDDSTTAFGEPILDSFERMKSWMVQYPREIIVLQSADMLMSVKTATWKALMQTAWNCKTVTTELELANLDTVADTDVGCLYFTSMPPQNLMLGDLVEKNYRVITVSHNNVFLQDTWTSNYNKESYRNDDLYDYHEGIAETAMSHEEGLYMFSIFQSQAVPDAKTLAECNGLGCLVTAVEQITGINLACNYVLGKATNSHFYPSSDPVSGRYLSSADGCDGACCKGYRSPLEVLHQQMLDRGATIWGVISDYISVGEQSETVLRMNEATLRRINGEQEPGVSWIECNEGAFWSIAGVSLGFILTVTAVIVIKTKCCGWSKYQYLAAGVKRHFLFCLSICCIDLGQDESCCWSVCCPCCPWGCSCSWCCKCCRRARPSKEDPEKKEDAKAAPPGDADQKASVESASTGDNSPEQPGLEDLESQPSPSQI